MTDKTLSSEMQISVEQTESIICDGGIVDEIIDEFGQDVIVRSIALTPDLNDAYDDLAETNTDRRTVAFVNSYNQDDDEVKEGVFKAGNVVLSFQIADESYISVGNQVWFDNKWWDISSVGKNYSANSTFMITATVKRI